MQSSKHTKLQAMTKSNTLRVATRPNAPRATTAPGAVQGGGSGRPARTQRKAALKCIERNKAISRQETLPMSAQRTRKANRRAVAATLAAPSSRTPRTRAPVHQTGSLQEDGTQGGLRRSARHQGGRPTAACATRAEDAQGHSVDVPTRQRRRGAAERPGAGGDRGSQGSASHSNPTTLAATSRGDRRRTRRQEPRGESGELGRQPNSAEEMDRDETALVQESGSNSGSGAPLLVGRNRGSGVEVAMAGGVVEGNVVVGRGVEVDAVASGGVEAAVVEAATVVGGGAEVEVDGGAAVEVVIGGGEDGVLAGGDANEGVGGGLEEDTVVGGGVEATVVGDDVEVAAVVGGGAEVDVEGGATTEVVTGGGEDGVVDVGDATEGVDGSGEGTVVVVSGGGDGVEGVANAGTLAVDVGDAVMPTVGDAAVVVGGNVDVASAAEGGGDAGEENGDGNGTTRSCDKGKAWDREWVDGPRGQANAGSSSGAPKESSLSARELRMQLNPSSYGFESGTLPPRPISTSSSDFFQDARARLLPVMKRRLKKEKMWMATHSSSDKKYGTHAKILTKLRKLLPWTIKDFRENFGLLFDGKNVVLLERATTVPEAIQGEAADAGPAAGPPEEVDDVDSNLSHWGEDHTDDGSVVGSDGSNSEDLPTEVSAGHVADQNATDGPAEDQSASGDAFLTVPLVYGALAAILALVNTGLQGTTAVDPAPVAANDPNAGTPGVDDDVDSTLSGSDNRNPDDDDIFDWGAYYSGDRSGGSSADS
ncbi:hypothetical protein M427DRAFT_46997 [Gonapodya prolifera JEL478]|uniref:Uncharacterized protein n=1 Tax=Gonapodya prolifera (strain JEL478) TaxID=1344416 RepID=A0A139A499_GONPJ|nr:hypothetical protein M427DRAFT_46997 [Gonapodya prolifera JEL478]|eukprot:KXS11621.1 hypothetical protein M427DRAFT_46997 [Gonapodya prolifera JEL478]